MSFLGAFGDGLSVGPSSSSHKRASSRHRSKRGRSRSRSRTRGTGNSFVDGLFGESSSSYNKHDASRAFFGLGNSSRSSFFGFGGGRPSYYKRSPRSGFISRAFKQLKRLIRDLMHYAKRHPWKVFFLVIMPLVSGGALTALLARFGLRLPPSLERMMGMAARGAGGAGGFGLASEAARAAGNFAGGGGSRGYGGYGGYGGGHDGYGRSHSGGGGNFGGWEQSIMGVAKMFI